MPARRPAAAAFAASIVRRCPSMGESECIMTQPPAASTIAAFSRIASSSSILNPHQSDQTAMQVPLPAQLRRNLVRLRRVMKHGDAEAELGATRNIALMSLAR